MPGAEENPRKRQAQLWTHGHVSRGPARLFQSSTILQKVAQVGEFGGWSWAKKVSATAVFPPWANSHKRASPLPAPLFRYMRGRSIDAPSP
jgi:hypothetical protein